MVSLVGEQPIPNLLPVKHYQPHWVLLVYSNFTQRAAKRFARLIKNETEVSELEVDAYDIVTVQEKIAGKLCERVVDTDKVIFNITGGTKPMSLAAFLVATREQANVCYLQTEGKKSRLFSYKTSPSGPVFEQNIVLTGLITISDYLNAYLDSYNQTGFAKVDPGRSFEEAIYKVLEPSVDEILKGTSLLNALEVDFVVRCENQVGIIEAKTGKKALTKEGIDQLNTAGGRDYLGTYTQKFFVIDREWTERSNLRELAQARGIHLIEMPSYGSSNKISEKDAAQLRQVVTKALGKEVTP